MGNFRSDNRREGGFGRDRPRFGNRRTGGFSGRSESGFGDRRGFRDRNSRGFGERRAFQRTEVTCDKCGKQCDVPFKPTSGKPIFCRECFGSAGGRSNAGSSPMSSSGSGISQEQFSELNTKLDKILKILEMIEFEEEDEAEEAEAEAGEETEDEEEKE